MMRSTAPTTVSPGCEASQKPLVKARPLDWCGVVRCRQIDAGGDDAAGIKAWVYLTKWPEAAQQQPGALRIRRSAE